MALNLVTVRARTRGKSPQEFTYQGVGRLSPRSVMSTEKDSEGKFLPIKREDGTVVEVDDIDPAGMTENFQEVIDLYGTLSEDERSGKTALQHAIDGAINWFNAIQRKNASPVVEVVTEDELTPVVAALVAAKILTDEQATTWRRTVTMGAKLIESERMDFAKMSKEYKKLPADVRKTLEAA